MPVRSGWFSPSTDAVPETDRGLDRWARAYLGLAGLLVAFVAGYVVNGRRSGDVYWHAATIERFAGDPWSPVNPMVGTTDPDVGFSPYGLALGLLSRETGLSGFAVLDLMALVLLLVFVALFPSAVRVLTGEPSAPALALALTLAAWGLEPWRWSGYLSLNSVGFMSGYPSMAAWCALLGAVIITGRLVRDPGWVWLVALAAVMAFIALTHAITLIGAVPLVLGVALGAGWRYGCRLLLPAAGLTIVAVAAWPYFSPFDLLAGGDAFDDLNRPTYQQVLSRSVLAVPGVVALVWRARRSPLDPLVVTGVLAGLVFASGHVTERWTLGRSLPFVLFAAHLALAAAVIRQMRDARAAPARRYVVGSGVACLLIVGIFGSRSGVAVGIPRDLLPPSLRDDARLSSERHRFDDVADDLGPGDVVVSLDLVATRAVPALGASSLWPGFPTPYVDDTVQRQRDAARYFFGDDPSERAAIVRRYGITHAMVSVHHTDVPDELVLVEETDRYRLFAVP